MRLDTLEYAVILNQACDLDLDHHARWGTNPRPNRRAVAMDKMLRSVLVCPAYPEDDLLFGRYLRPIRARTWDGTEKNIILRNGNERFHCLEPEDPLLGERLILDFKIAIGVTPVYLEWWIKTHPDSRVATLRSPFSEKLLQRFANYLVRVAEPEDED